MADIEYLCLRHSQGLSARSNNDSWWQELGEFVSPRKAEITTKSNHPGENSDLYDSTATNANMTLAQGQMSYVSPSEERWFALEPPEALKHLESARSYYAICTEIMATALADSNFYSEIHELYLDRSGFGIGNLYAEESTSNASGLLFDACRIGSYWVSENNEKLIDTVFRERKMTARQLKQEFGEENLPKKVLEALKESSKQNDTFTVVHAVYPREGRDVTKADGANMPIASCWFMPELKHELREGGYDTMPYCVSRYLKWGDSPYGWCPGWTALPDAKQLNFLEKMLDTLAEVTVFPRMLIPSSVEGEVDITAGGATVYNPFNNAKPEEWLTGGRYDVGSARAERKEKNIREAYHYDLFKMFAQIEKQMTAREVAERSGEKLLQFSPTFARMTTELFNPLLNRVFRLLMRGRKFPQPPEDIIQIDRMGEHIAPPKIQYRSRIALAIRALQSSGFMNMLEAIQPIMAIDPSTRHIINTEKATRGLARNFGVPEEWLASEEEYQAAMQQEAEAEQAQAQMNTIEQGANAAGKLPPEMVDGLATALEGDAD